MLTLWAVLLSLKERETMRAQQSSVKVSSCYYLVIWLFSTLFLSSKDYLRLNLPASCILQCLTSSPRLGHRVTGYSLQTVLGGTLPWKVFDMGTFV